MSDTFDITINEFSSDLYDFCVTGILEQDEHLYWYPVVEHIYLFDKHNKLKIWLYNYDRHANHLFNMMEDWKVFSMEELKDMVKSELGM